MLEKIFKLRENNTNVKTEFIAGSTTFLSMAYIIFVQPAVLSIAGMDFDSVMMATCLSSAIACLVMAFAANYPIALAPGMGENFYFVFTVVLGMGIAWEKALGAVFISGVIFLILTLLRVREMIIDAIPETLKNAMPAAIGIFITFIGLVQAGIIVKDPGGGIVSLGNLHSRPTLLALIGLFIIVFLMIRNVKGAMLLGMLCTAVIGLVMGIIKYGGIVSVPPSIEPTFLKLDILGAFQLGFVTVLIIFLLMDMFDTIGTFIGVTQATGLMKNGEMPRATNALMADAIGTVTGAMLGTSTVTSYIESTTGVREGGRTGLTSVVVALFMLLAIFFKPLVSMVGGGVPIMNADGNLAYTLYPVTAPALILVGSFMASSLTRCVWDDLTEAIPAFMMIVGMALTYNISHGLAFGFILYPVLKLMAGRSKEVSWLMYILAAIFIVRYAFIS
ncbi:MAG TPA: NCS2 family permease [bacterium]|nr:NCS2 family permease [bacterium]